MSRNLGNIPQQVKMSEEQEQTFTNGMNNGRKLENERVLTLLDKRITFLGSQKTKQDSALAEELERMYTLIKGENK